ncbi:hypothetical protein [Paraliomyxa miuraensis]|uniref:hypothetical protein n=1 Tax=Paraliomyxa miuraensis TaxID=376150 RepID=UPI00225B9D52|nr:hypothetical protein [Paraliomyxa miuraensis]MCX4246213.1 hypothetical protein [Paraliomyxa miuraensis]
MRRRVRCLGGSVLLVAALGCGPPLRRLTEQRAYDQALCAASERSRDPAHDLEWVAGRLDADARPRLHLYAVPREELERSLGEAGRRLAEQVVLVRAVVAIDGVQIDDFGVRVALLGEQGPVPSQPASLEAIASLVGETIPEDEVQRIESRRELVPERFARRPLMGVVAGVFEASTLFIVPVTEITGHTRRRPEQTIRTPPSEDEVVAAAPVASLLASEVQRWSHVEYGDGKEISSVWLWPRSLATESATLVVEWSYAAHGCAGRKPAMRRYMLDTAEAVRTVSWPLPPGGELESRINALFGDRMQPLLP